MRRAGAASLLVVLAACGAADDLESQARLRRFDVPLWPQGPPSGNELEGPEQGGSCIANISEAVLSVSLPVPGERASAAVVVCPGGGYRVVCIEREGGETAEWLTERGLAAIVLKYRLPNGHPTVPGDDLRQAVRTVRRRAAEWGVDPQRVGAWGFSAGGHLAATAATGAGVDDPVEREAGRPDLLILCYPVVSMEIEVTHAGSRRELLGPDPAPDLVERFSPEARADGRCPPAFLIHCRDDTSVSLANSVRFRDRLSALDVPVELVTFERGGHGPGALDANPSWSTRLEDWLAHQGWR